MTATLDAAGFPHLFQQIISFSDRPTLATLLRLSHRTHQLALPFLYPSTLVDPLGHTSHSAKPLTDERIKAKIDSFLSSPHLEQAKTIVINDRKPWADYIGRCKTDWVPAHRGEGTTTIIRVLRSDAAHSVSGVNAPTPGDAMKEGAAMGEAGRGIGQRGQGGKGRARRTLADEQADLSDSDDINILNDIADIASFLPSEHIVIHVPALTGICIDDIMHLVGIGLYPEESAKRLTLVIEVEDTRDNHQSPVVKARDSRRLWEHIEVVLVPASCSISSAFPVIRPGPDSHSHNKTIDVWSSRSLILNLAPCATYTIHGLEDLSGGRNALMNLFKSSARLVASMRELELGLGMEESYTIAFQAVGDWRCSPEVAAALCGAGGSVDSGY